jgi:hypothetical protein
MVEVFEKIYKKEKEDFKFDYTDSGYIYRFDEKEGIHLLTIWFEIPDTYGVVNMSKSYKIDTNGNVISSDNWEVE